MALDKTIHQKSWRWTSKFKNTFTTRPLVSGSVISIYNWSKNFSQSDYEKSEAKMAAIVVQ